MACRRGEIGARGVHPELEGAPCAPLRGPCEVLGPPGLPLRTLAPPPLPASQACRERAPSHMPRTVPPRPERKSAAPSGCRNLQGAGRKRIPPARHPDLPAAPTTRRAHDLCGPYGARSLCTCRRRALHHGVRSSCDARLASASRCTTGPVVPACAKCGPRGHDARHASRSSSSAEIARDLILVSPRDCHREVCLDWRTFRK